MFPETSGNKRPLKAKGSSTPPDTSEDESTTTEEELKPTPATEQKSVKRTKPSSKPQFYKPDPIARIFRRAHEATVEVNGVLTTCLVDTGATVTIINADFWEQQGLEIHSIDRV